MLAVDDMQHVFHRQWLEIEFVSRVIIGADRLWIGVDHNRFITVLAQRETGVNAAIIKLDPLADTVGAAAEDNDLLAIRPH